MGVGLGVGSCVGMGVGLDVGACVGIGVGLGVGASVGIVVGLGVGRWVGKGEGLAVGSLVRVAPVSSENNSVKYNRWTTTSGKPNAKVTFLNIFSSLRASSTK